MVDFARITATGGAGGAGAASFHHIKGKRYGKADGGDGGRGGHVYLMATVDLNTLEPFRYVKEYHARNGQNGAPNRRHGADGQDLLIKVPVGTQVKETPVGGTTGRVPNPTSLRFEGHSSATFTGGLARRSASVDGKESRDRTRSEVYDLLSSGQKVLVATGGEGGRGNAHLKDEFGRRPRFAEPGDEGETAKLTLELKLIADVGLIGLPNAGKSTLLASLTAARPAIAAYPFTTLEPNLGVLSLGKGKEASMDKGLGHKSNLGKPNNFTSKPNRLPNLSPTTPLILADIPGLIEGASQGKGLGDLFLRHIERTRVLVHLIDISALATPDTFDTLWQNYQAIRNELKNYSKELAKKKEIIVLTKIDLVNQKQVQEAIGRFAAHRKKAIPLSGKTGQGLPELIRLLASRV